jgi:hypothetical protein
MHGNFVCGGQVAAHGIPAAANNLSGRHGKTSINPTAAANGSRREYI